MYSGKQFFNGFLGIISSNKSFLLRNTNMGVALNNGFWTISVKSARLSCILFTELSSNSTGQKKEELSSYIFIGNDEEWMNELYDVQILNRMVKH